MSREAPHRLAMPMPACPAPSGPRRDRRILLSSSPVRSAPRPRPSRRTRMSIARSPVEPGGARQQVGCAGPFGDGGLHDDAGLVHRQYWPPFDRTRLRRTAVGHNRVGADRVSRRHRGILAHLWPSGRHAGTQAALPGRSRGLHCSARRFAVLRLRLARSSPRAASRDSGRPPSSPSTWR